MLLMPRPVDDLDAANAKVGSPPCSVDDESSSVSSDDGGTPGGLVTKLNKHDVLMGRGAPSAEYEGNARLRGIVLDRRGDYVDARKRKDKHRIAVEIIETVYAHKGRFLRRIEDEEKLKAHGLDPKQAAWDVVKDRTELLSKVKQLLRDIGPEARSKRAARRQERKHKRDSAWDAKGSGGEEGDAAGLSTSESSKSHTILLKPAGSAHAAPHASLSEHQVAAFRAGTATGLRQALPSSIPGNPYAGSQIQGTTLHPSVLSAAAAQGQQQQAQGQLPSSLLPGSLFGPSLGFLRLPSSDPRHLLGYPGSSSLLSSLRQEQLALELMRQRQQQSLMAQLYGGSPSLLAAAAAEQELAQFAAGPSPGAAASAGNPSFRLPPPAVLVVHPPPTTGQLQRERSNASQQSNNNSESKRSSPPPPPPDAASR